MNVVWSNRALRSLADIHSHILTESEEAANRMIDGILKRGDPCQFDHLRILETALETSACYPKANIV